MLVVCRLSENGYSETWAWDPHCSCQSRLSHNGRVMPIEDKIGRVTFSLLARGLRAVPVLIGRISLVGVKKKTSNLT
jgi:hypothetical protein